MIYIDKKSRIPLYEQIYSYYVKEILSGAFAAGERLPATRQLAEDLSVGRNTVDRAYQQLTAEGYIQPKAGSGFTVNDIPMGPALAVEADPVIYEEQRGEDDIRYDFAYGSMDNSVFPYNQWRKSIANALAVMENENILRYPSRTGEPELRREIARYLHHSRAVSCTPEQVVITCGQQHSMEIIANMFHKEGRGFAMEDPGYDGIRAIFVNHRFRMDYIPVEADGISIEALRHLDTDLVYITPSHQFPTGAVLSIAKRRELLRWADSTDTYLIEDDYDSELRYYTNPIPAMQSLDENQRTIYTGTFSKSLAPSMRLAYIVFPQSLLQRYYDYYHRYNSQVSTLHQLAMADFIASGYYERHINRLRTVYKKKQEALLDAIEAGFGHKARVLGEGAGIHLLLDVKGSLPQEELIERAEAIGVRCYPSRVFYMDESRCPKGQLLLGFPTVPQEAFGEIMEKLRIAWNM